MSFVLFSPSDNAWKWDHSSHESLLAISMLFTWHCGAVFTLLCFVGTIMHYCLQRTEYGQVDIGHVMDNKLLHHDRGEHTFMSLQGEDSV